MTEQGALYFVLSMFSLCCLTYAVFLKLMKQEYRKTFWSVETGNHWAQKIFLEGSTEEIRMHVVTMNRMKWKPIEQKVRAFLEANWGRLMLEKPIWFTESWK
jgi:hypothetical protein